jgi:hypothetical protein
MAKTQVKYKYLHAYLIISVVEFPAASWFTVPSADRVTVPVNWLWHSASI